MSGRMMARSANINVMVKAAQKAGKSLRHDFQEVEHLQVSMKSIGDFVSTADKNAEKIILEDLRYARPDFGFLLEESGEIQGKDPGLRFIVDPLDGTTNFLHGVPHFAVAIALEYRGEITAAVTYNPINDELFWAEKGVGAYLNQSRLRVSARKDMQSALFATGIPFGEHGDKPSFVKKLNSIMPHVAGVRRFGAASLDLAYVAAGRFDGYFEESCQPWDLAGGLLMVKEAGGFMCDMKGGTEILKSGSVLATNDKLHQLAKKLLIGE